MAVWKKCNSCGNEIEMGEAYQRCSVSNCRKFAFCSVDCWSLHNEHENHKSAYAEEETAPMSSDDNREPRRVLVKAPSTSSSNSSSHGAIPRDILIVTSKLKAYVKAKHDLNTSGNVTDALSDIVRFHVDKACEKAKQDARKTLMDRDF